SCRKTKDIASCSSGGAVSGFALVPLVGAGPGRCPWLLNPRRVAGSFGDAEVLSWTFSVEDQMATIIDRRASIALFGSAIAWPLAALAKQHRLLYCTHAAGYRHDAIPLSQTILGQLGKNSGLFDVTATEDMPEFTTEKLARYAAVMFYTTGELPMGNAQ